MAQLVSDFIITPVLRQARRFSSGFASNEPPAIEAPALQRRRTRSTGTSAAAAAGSAILEGEEYGIPSTGGAVLDSSDAATRTPNRTQQAPGRAAGPVSSSPSPAENSSTADSNSHANTAPNGQPDTRTANAAADAAPLATWPLPESNRGAPLPEDDGMGDLRRRIQAIQVLEVAQDAKAVMMHGLLTEKYTSRLQLSPSVAAMRPVSRGSTSTLDIPEPAEHIGALQAFKKWNPLGDGPGPLNLPLTEEDLRPTFGPGRRPAERAEWWTVGEQQEEEEEARRHGCEHYRRNIKLQCASCERWYTCRHCHDAVEDHVLPRQQTKHMLCMLCGCAQKASDTCTKCGQSAACYYCAICKLWNDDPNKPIYHCSDCGLCRVGQGLGKDFFHCKKCMACISMSETNNHKCIERAADSDCPICNEYLFNSPKSVTFMQCGHSIHLLCFEELKKTSYRCPLCNKSCVNMEYHFRQLDMHILQQPMPPDYADSRAVISCIDCCAKSQTAFHWLGLKCAVCRSYNTTQLQLLNMPGNVAAEQPQPQQEQQQESPQQQQQGHGPVALDPVLVADEMRRRDRAARREEAWRQRDQDRETNNNNNLAYQSFALLSTSPSSYSPAFLLRLLNRTASSPEQQPEQAVRPPSSSSRSAAAAAAAAASSSSSTSARALGITPRTTAAAAAGTNANATAGCDSEEEEDEDDDMLDLFGARDRDFDRMTGLTSAESAVGFDDDDEDGEEEEESSGDEEEEDRGEEEDDEEEDDDILLFGHR
ncbi:hypothetical protein C8A00DRAFT_11721 [Chaetomidium leptoderma]|uniref:Uncharacterized protein n=1 Tax=Chaetomidium leptoderma TaxID=669021 RepID=A0AAN6VUB4_9PEZI|nr:hypothetical protein C8A00DRAFT_11721 [Chaetomidium leptoderma]